MFGSTRNQSDHLLRRCTKKKKNTRACSTILPVLCTFSTVKCAIGRFLNYYYGHYNIASARTRFNWSEFAAPFRNNFVYVFLSRFSRLLWHFLDFVSHFIILITLLLFKELITSQFHTIICTIKVQVRHLEDPRCLNTLRKTAIKHQLITEFFAGGFTARWWFGEHETVNRPPYYQAMPPSLSSPPLSLSLCSIPLFLAVAHCLYINTTM